MKTFDQTRRAGVLLPLFSIRTANGFGVGEIPDIVPFADEILLGLGTLLLANFKKRKEPDVIEPRR